MIRFWPEAVSTKIGATPLDTPFDDPDVLGVDAEALEVLDRGRAEQIVADPGDHRDVGAAEAAATAWLAPLPPKPISKLSPKMVSPARGNRSLKVVRSTLALPTTAMRCGREVVLDIGLVFETDCSSWLVIREWVASDPLDEHA